MSPYGVMLQVIHRKLPFNLTWNDCERINKTIIINFASVTTVFNAITVALSLNGATLNADQYYTGNIFKRNFVLLLMIMVIAANQYTKIIIIFM